MAEEVKQNTPEATAQQILADNSKEQPQETVATPEQPATTETPDVSSLVDKRLQDFIGKEQGRLAQVSGQKIAK